MTRRKVCVITCYKDVNYVRGSVIRNSLSSLPDYEIISVKNNKSGFVRYFEVLLKLFLCRIKHRPDIYVLTFRGYEILPFVRLLTVGKKLIFDEFINLIEWTVYEHKKIKENGILAKILYRVYRQMLLSTDKILSDTKAHADYSAKLMNLPPSKYSAVPVSADESIFKPQKPKKNNNFEVFYYGNMLPLHGIRHVYDAAKIVYKINKNIHFTIIGGGEDLAELTENTNSKGANISHIKRVSLEDLVSYIDKSDICLGGPFGGTVQSQYVITGKTFQFMACQRPVIIGKTKVSGQFEDKKNCLIVEQANAQDLSQKIIWALDNREALIKIAGRGRSLYRAQYSNEKISQILTKILD